MKKFFLTILFVSFSISIFSQQLSKVYILSEGGFSPNTSALSLLDLNTNQFTPNIFTGGNLGLYPNGLIFHNDRLYITEQGNFGSSGKIYRLDTLGIVQVSAVVGTNPYSLAIANNKIYITNGPASNVTVLNLADFSFVKNIPVGVYPQEIIEFSGKIFVANNSLFGGSADSTVTVIDPIRDSVIATIVVKKDPSSFAVSNDNHLLIGCPGDQNSGRIFKVNPQTFQIVDIYTVPNFGFSKDISVDKNSNDIYFISNNNDIVKFNLSTRQSSIVVSSVFPNNFYYGYAYDYVNSRHYVLDAKNFTVNGNLYIYSNNGTLLNTYQTSIAPRRILFKYVSPSTKVEDNLIAENFQLNQNYPNPFNPNTTISWQSPVSGWQTIKVFNSLGEEIETIVDGYYEAGNHSTLYIINSTLPSGVYFYQLRIANPLTGMDVYVSTKKMILSK
jgi:hypothetical protein